MYIDWNTLITAASILTALGVVIGAILKGHKWYLAQNAQSAEIAALKAQHEEDIKHLKKENTLVCYGLSVVLDGLIQLGANHEVPKAKEKLDKYLNQQAHE